MSTANKLTYLNGTKQAIKQAINEDFEVIDNNTTFREYAEEISSNNAKYKDLIPKETKNATNTLDISNSSGLDKALVTQYGNTYQEGEPTPDSPQEIHVVSGDNTIKVCGKNLFNYNDITTSAQYTNNYDGTFTRNSNGSNILINVNGASVPYNTFSLLAGTYSVSFDIKTTATATLTNFFICTRQNGTTANLSKNIGVQIPANTTTHIKAENYVVVNNAEKVGFTGYLNASTGVVISNIQVEKNTQATTYEAYKGASYPINLGDIELCKIGDYKDRIYPLNGKWYLEKQIGKLVLDGSENWGISSGNFYMTRITNYKRSENKPYSNYYQGTLNTGSASGITNGEIAFNTAIEFNRFYLSNTSISSVNDIKNWLNTHNTEVYYVLATPTTEEITESNYPTLYNQLNNIKLFEGVNHITMTNESGLDVEFDITYYKDWKLD